MAKTGNSGSIVVNSSCSGSRVSTLPAMRGGALYAATKAAADMLMKYAAIEVSRWRGLTGQLALGGVGEVGTRCSTSGNAHP